MPTDLLPITRIYAEVVNACRWYESLPISVDETRLSRLCADLEELALNRDDAESNALASHSASLESYQAVMDGAAFARIHQFLSGQSRDHLPRRKLKVILAGPQQSTLEIRVGEQTTARDHLFELELAAHLASYELEILGFDDVKFDFEGVPYWIECKRPQKESTLLDRTREEYSKLWKQMPGDNDRGIVSLAVEKVFELDRTVQKVRSAAEITALVAPLAEKVHAWVAAESGSWIDNRVVGVMAIFRFLVDVDQPRSVGPTFTVALLITASHAHGQGADFARLMRLVRLLQH